MKVVAILEVNKEKLAETGHSFDEEMGKMSQSGNPVITEKICRGRFNEYVEKGWFMDCYDTNKVFFKKRMVFILCGGWEETIKEDRLCQTM